MGRVAAELSLYGSVKSFQDLKMTTAQSNIQVIPQGTVDNNLGPDRLAGPKALVDPNYFRQPTL